MEITFNPENVQETVGNAVSVAANVMNNRVLPQEERIIAQGARQLSAAVDEGTRGLRNVLLITGLAIAGAIVYHGWKSGKRG